jgi:hypothetical protein
MIRLLLLLLLFENEELLEERTEGLELGEGFLARFFEFRVGSSEGHDLIGQQDADKGRSNIDEFRLVRHDHLEYFPFSGFRRLSLIPLCHQFQHARFQSIRILHSCLRHIHIGSFQRGRR